MNYLVLKKSICVLFLMFKSHCNDCKILSYCRDWRCSDCNRQLIQKQEDEFKISKKNIMDIFEKFKEDDSVYESTFIPDEDEFKNISNYFELNLDPSKWYSYLLGNNEYKRYIMLTAKQAASLINYVTKKIKLKDNYDNTIYKYCWALDNFILLVKSMENTHPYFKQYCSGITNKTNILKNWNNKFCNVAKKGIPPTKIEECILCDTDIMHTNIFITCLHCNKKIHFKCNVNHHRKLYNNKKEIVCKNCGESNVELKKDLILYNLKKQITVNRKFRELTYLEYMYVTDYDSTWNF